jgi:arylsulfatase A-like enzyme
MRRRDFATMLPAAGLLAQRSDRPNILWITGEDMGPQLSCYGFLSTRTENIDRLASEGTRFTHAFTSAPVCSSSRSGFMTGMYQTSIGAHNHRSHRTDGYRLPKGAALITERLREAGYFTCNVREIAPGVTGSGKTDFNFTVDKEFDGTHWNQRAKGQPFFAHLNFTAPHKGPSFPRARKVNKSLVDPAKLELPPYWPDHPVVRDEYANFLDAIQLLDTEVGATLDALKKDGLAQNTVVFFFGDNGRCLIRGKQWCYDAGLHIPLIVRWPGGDAKPGAVRDDLVSALDLSATALWLAGVTLPAGLHGRPLFGPQAQPRGEVYSARDRCDMTMDRIRTVRDKRFRYIRNFMPDRPYTQWNQYIENSYPTLGVMKELHGQGKLNATQSLFMAPAKPPEELYDVLADPHEVNNLAASKPHQGTLLAMRAKIDRWVWETNDQGRFPETPVAERHQ